MVCWVVNSKYPLLFSPSTQTVDLLFSLVSSINHNRQPSTHPDSMEDIPAIVLDNGSGMVKAGFSGDDAPRCVFPSLVGVPRHDRAMLGAAPKETFVGDDALMKKGVLTLRYPVEHGVITSWEDMERVWNHTFYSELRAAPEEHHVLLTEAPMNPRANRERMAQSMFETFGVPGVHVSVQAVLSLYSAGRTTGTVLDMGDGVSHTVPVYEGYQMPHAVQRIDLAGRDLTEFMGRLLMQEGRTFVGSAGAELVRSIKEGCCIVGASSEEALGGGCPLKEFELPDGEVMQVGSSRMRCPEALFNPCQLMGRDIMGIHELVHTTINRCDIDVRRELYDNIVLSGGTTMFNGLRQRLVTELQRLCPPTITPKVIAPEERKYSVWIGGSILSSLTTFQNQWVTKRDYDENGPGIINAKCF